MSDEEDTSLVEKAQRGERSAFASLVDRHRGAVHGYLRARVLQPEDGDDLTQETFVRFYLGLSRFRAGEPLLPWLLGIARNLLREYARRGRRRKEVAWTEICLEIEDAAGARDDGAYDDAMRHLPACLDALGSSARHAVDLHYTGSLRFAEIAERLRRSEGAVKLLMFRARAALKHCLGSKLEARGDAGRAAGDAGAE